ncbi:24104_t:CDS:2 [Dentiscutata erythropus]|uniref:24104_t:CDS:1 n=1 Tax=Dentiscutata erythropus TaxID=1348616 RepID=A0A9N9ATP2_9GLOM|nr:24104_t:CDS:2 [Dentiscutata erythropus]
MSTAKEENMMPEFIEKLEKSLKLDDIKSFDYSQFGNLNRIGEGGFAVVYSSTFNGQIYALKSLNLNLKFEEKEFRQLKREIKCLYTIESHPNIVKFHGISREKSKFDDFDLYYVGIVQIITLKMAEWYVLENILFLALF